MLFKIQPVLEDSLTQWMNTPGTSAPITAAQGTSTANTPITTPATATNADKWQNANIIAQTSSSALNAFSSLTSARQQSSNLNANAQLLDQQANQAILNAGQQSALIRRRGAQFQGDQDARIAASGTGFGGTNALLRRQTALNIQEDANAVANEGILQSDALKNEAGAMRQQSKAARPGLLGYLGQVHQWRQRFSGRSMARRHNLLSPPFQENDFKQLNKSAQ